MRTWSSSAPTTTRRTEPARPDRPAVRTIASQSEADRQSAGRLFVWHRRGISQFPATSHRFVTERETMSISVGTKSPLIRPRGIDQPASWPIHPFPRPRAARPGPDPCPASHSSPTSTPTSRPSTRSSATSPAARWIRSCASATSSATGRTPSAASSSPSPSATRSSSATTTRPSSTRPCRAASTTAPRSPSRSPASCSPTTT